MNIIKTCSCFIDKAVWFINLPEKQACRPWLFDHVRTQTSLQDIIENKFIKEVRTKTISIGGKSFTKNTVVISCVDCFDFQVLQLSFEEKSIFDTINCRFVTRDSSTFDDYYCSDIFTGNSQFVVENYFFSREQREMIFNIHASSSDIFSRQPLHKSCFTSLQKRRYRFFCTTCKKIYNHFFERMLHAFASTVKNESNYELSD